MTIATAGTRALTFGYLSLAVASLLLSGVFVVLVAIARTPLVVLVAGRDYLFSALAGHVVFALDVWLVSFAGLLWVLAAARMNAPLGRLAAYGLAGAAAGAALMAAVPLAGSGLPIMADYVPIMTHPVYLIGLGAFFGSVAATAIAVLRSIKWLGAPVEVQALGLGALAYLAALVVVGIVGIRHGASDYAQLVWGGGHLLQVVNVSALVALWLAATPSVSGRGRSLIRASLSGLALATAVVVAAFALDLAWDAIAVVFWTATGAPAIVTWAVVTYAQIRGISYRSGRPTRPEFLAYSLLLFGMGGLIALPGMGDDTRVTAHYHGVVGAVTLMLMAEAYRLVGLLKLRLAWPSIARAQAHLYGGGLVALVVGLFLAGEAGAPRKTFEAISRGEATPASALFVLGALATVAGGIAFVSGVGMTLLRDLPEVTIAARREPTELLSDNAIRQGG